MVAIFLQIVKQLLIYPKEKLSTIYNIHWKCMISKYCNIVKGQGANFSIFVHHSVILFGQYSMNGQAWGQVSGGEAE